MRDAIIYNRNSPSILVYEAGNSVVPNMGSAASYADRACALNARPACLRLAEWLERGTGISPDLGRAAGLYQKACDLEDANACVRLGAMSEEGRGVDRSEARALVLYRRACRIGNAAACRLPLLLREGVEP